MPTVGFNIFLFFHIIFLITGFGSVLVIDFFGLMWLLKKVQLSFIMKVANTTQKLIWIGWGGMVLSGTGLLTMKGFVDDLTKIKIFFVLMVGLNGIFLHFIKKNFESLQENQPIPPRYIFRMTLATTISQTGWWGALCIGFLHNHVAHYIDWPHNPYLYMVIIAALFIGIGLAGEHFFKQKTA